MAVVPGVRAVSRGEGEEVMSETTIPGIKAKHAIVTDQCRLNRTDEGAVDEALRRLREEALQCIDGWKGTPGVNFHFLLTVEKGKG